MREKAVFFLPVNILTVWSPAFLAALHTTVCLDIGTSQCVMAPISDIFLFTISGLFGSTFLFNELLFTFSGLFGSTFWFNQSFFKCFLDFLVAPFV